MKERRATVGVVILLAIALSICVSQPLTVSAASLNAEEAFNRLYSGDREFRNAVNEIRRMLAGDDFTEDDWIRLQGLFNLALSKAGMPTLDVLSSEELSEFRMEVEREAWNVKLLREWSANAISVTPAMSDQEEIDLAKQYVPLLRQPQWDIESPANNGLKSVYVDVHDESVYGYSLSGYYAIEVTLVFYDEDHPNPWLDWVYDYLIRLPAWGRIEDIETFLFVVNKPGSSTERVSFISFWILRYEPPDTFVDINIDGCYSGDQTWEDSGHYEAKITPEKVGEHPKLWVNTWNHMIGENDNNPPLENDHPYYLWNEPLNHGNRRHAEDVESGFMYVDEGLYADKVP